MYLIDKTNNKRSDGISLNNMIVLSLLLHALILSIILFSPSVPSPKWTFGPAYTVDLVTVPVNVAQTRTAKTIPWDTVKMDSRESSVVLKKSVDEIQAIPIKPIRVRRKEPVRNVDDAINKIKQKVASTPESLSQASSTVASASVPSADAGGKGQAEVNVKMQVYYSIVWAKIKEHWAWPEGMLTNNNLEAVLAAIIRKNGNLGGIEFEQRSGNQFFDESAEKAIKKAAPFPVLPEWLDENSIELGIRFRTSELLR